MLRSRFLLTGSLLGCLAAASLSSPLSAGRSVSSQEAEGVVGGQEGCFNYNDKPRLYGLFPSCGVVMKNDKKTGTNKEGMQKPCNTSQSCVYLPIVTTACGTY